MADLSSFKDRELAHGYAELGRAQRAGLEVYPSDSADGFVPEKQVEELFGSWRRHEDVPSLDGLAQ